jgi:hypothetical protein
LQLAPSGRCSAAPAGLLFVWLLLFAAPARPAETAPGWLHRNWTIRDGLPTNLVTQILHAPDGYLWISTFDGLARFDSVRFEVYRTRTTPGLRSNRIRQMWPGRDGALWVLGTSGELARHRGGAFEPLELPAGALIPSSNALAEAPVASSTRASKVSAVRSGSASESSSLHISNSVRYPSCVGITAFLAQPYEAQAGGSSRPRRSRLSTSARSCSRPAAFLLVIRWRRESTCTGSPPNLVARRSGQACVKSTPAMDVSTSMRTGGTPIWKISTRVAGMFSW